MGEEEKPPRSRFVTELSCDEARAFFLKNESYCTIELPRYFKFNELLNNVAQELEGTLLSQLWNTKPREFDDVNHPVLTNKDGRYDWRPLELIHPALYVSLVFRITECSHWNLILQRFRDFGRNPKIKCLSLPVESLTEEKDKAEQITQWWTAVEHKSIELALDYEFVVQTDIVDCYAAIYTHSISWALHTKETAKDNRNERNLIGNIIDAHLQDMKHGQTNGIPQGSVLMDFVAEMVLGYADTELTKKIKCKKIENYQILRYRDDYRLFVNNPQDGEIILKCLTEVMIDLGLKLSPSKTNFSDELIRSSIKDDKLSWTFRKEGHWQLQRHLLIIHDHSAEHPNSGSLVSAMFDYLKRLHASSKYDFPLPLIGIVVDIAYRNPNVYEVSALILLKLLSFLESEQEKRAIMKRIKRKFSQIPNTGHMEVWLQRISRSFYPDLTFHEPLCRLVREEVGLAEIWNNRWISSRQLRRAIERSSVIDPDEVTALPPVGSPKEVQLYVSKKTLY